MAHQLKR